MNERIQKRIDDMPESCRGIYQKAMKGKSKAAGVKAFCLECMGWNRAEVKRCDTVTCPLFPYRPFRSPENINGGAF